MPVLVLLVLVGVAYVVFSRQRELFVVSVRDGRALVVRGDCPDAVFDDIREIVQRANVRRATLRAIKTEHHARLVTDGVDDGTAQRMRNMFGVHPIHLRRTGGGSTRPGRNLGQLLGITWLAWLLAGRR